MQGNKQLTDRFINLFIKNCCQHLTYETGHEPVQTKKRLWSANYFLHSLYGFFSLLILPPFADLRHIIWVKAILTYCYTNTVMVLKIQGLWNKSWNRCEKLVSKLQRGHGHTGKQTKVFSNQWTVVPETIKEYYLKFWWPYFTPHLLFTQTKKHVSH